MLTHLPGLTDRYRLEHKLGAGGMADVYRATDVRHDRSVAVKVLRGDLGPSLDRERFLREIGIAARLQHPNILAVHDSGESDGQLFYVMPYLPDGTLRSRIQRDGTLEWTDALRIALEVADALAHAHAHDVIHRDIKPENILFSGRHAIVSDFGIAYALRHATEGERLTMAGFVLGTPEYMSPEQGLGEDIDARTDVYALGCVLYELLGGEPPFMGAPLAILARRMSETAPQLPPRAGATIPDIVHELLRVALATQPVERYGSAAELATALQDALAEAPAPIAVTPGRGTGRMARPNTPTVAVLPLANLGADATDEYLADGITDEIINRLSATPGLRVVGRTSAFALKGRALALEAIARELRVSHVLEGSLRRAGDRLRVTARLVEVATGHERWSQRYERELADVFAVQDEIAREIGEALVTAIGGVTTGTGARAQASAAVTGPPTRNVDAYERYLQGRVFWNRRTQTGLQRSIGSLRDAIAMDPEFALAHAALADAWVTLAIYGAEAPAHAMAEARVACLDALRLVPGLPEALPARAALSALHDWRWDRAETDYREAIHAYPSMPLARQSFATNVLLPLGRIDEALDQLAQARALDPLAPAVTLSIALAHYLARDWDRVERVCGAIIERDPDFGMAHYFLGQARRDEGRLDAALPTLHRAAELLGNSSESIAALGVAHALAGDRAGAERALAELAARATTTYVSPVHEAQVLLGLGDHEAALDRLYEATVERATELAWLGVRPVYAPLRGHQRFTRLVKRLGLAS